ncbi:tol-pal system YbgF family protein [Streptomyces sp. AJS327]|uniref:tetratricopeptide repeat protein n=1 Tax=Streptomyces sp. AJS327 TaxID=2545265 RepID=UPI00215578FD|nr:hypothetical protein [Streptomyces sp. AJS327]
MARSARKARRLVVEGETFLWSVGHRHRDLGNGRYEDCRECLDIRRSGVRGLLRVVFREGPGRLVPDGYMPSGAVGTGVDRTLNLHEPGTVHALLRAAVARGWRPDGPGPVEVDGWALFDPVELRRRVPGAASRAWSPREVAEEEAALAATAPLPARRHRHLLLAAWAHHDRGRADEARARVAAVLRDDPAPEQAADARRVLAALDAMG